MTTKGGKRVGAGRPRREVPDWMLAEAIPRYRASKMSWAEIAGKLGIDRRTLRERHAAFQQTASEPLGKINPSAPPIPLAAQRLHRNLRLSLLPPILALCMVPARTRADA